LGSAPSIYAKASRLNLGKADISFRQSNDQYTDLCKLGNPLNRILSALSDRVGGSGAVDAFAVPIEPIPGAGVF